MGVLSLKKHDAYRALRFEGVLVSRRLIKNGFLPVLAAWI